MSKFKQSNSSLKNGLPLKQTLYIIALTVIYLIFELAFNARLLDVAGGLEVEAVPDLEHYGRLLSGTAVALFVLQYLLGKRARSRYAWPSLPVILFWCLLSLGLTYGALKLVVDQLVHATSGDFRKASANLVLIRSEMIKGSAQLSGLGDDPALFEKPEGKAFAALFPLFGTLVWQQIDEKIKPAKLQLLQKSVNSEIGGVEFFYKDAYLRAIDEVRNAHQGKISPSKMESISQEESSKEWSRYEADLRKRGWTPARVPRHAYKRVVAEMQKRLNVPSNWRTDDRSTFNEKITARIKNRFKDNAGAVYKDNKIIASGLSFAAYVAHPHIQSQLQTEMKLPADVAVLPAYASAEEFRKKLYLPVVHEQAKKELKRLELPAIQYLPLGTRADAGFKAAQAVLISPIALWFSLLGAITHLCKLMYQLTRLVVIWVPVPGLARLRFLTLAVPLVVLLGLGALISRSDTKATLSSAHQFLRTQAIEAADNGGSYVQTRLLLGAMHAVEVGQSHAYPLNHAIHTQLLGNFSFGGASAEKGTAKRK